MEQCKVNHSVRQEPGKEVFGSQGKSRKNCIALARPVAVKRMINGKRGDRTNEKCEV